MASILNATTTSGLVTSADNSGSLQLQTNNGTTAVTIDTSQRAAFVAGTAALPAITTSGDTDTGVYFSAANTLDFATNGTAAAQLDSSQNFKFNSGYGSVATAYGCRAWVNFNGTGTVAIRASGNVTSITDNGVGDYTVNFTNAMPDANYATTGLSKTNGAATAWVIARANVATATTSVRILTFTATGGSGDVDEVNVSVFR